MKLLSTILAFGLTIVVLTQTVSAAAPEKDFVWYCESDEATEAQKVTVNEIYKATNLDPEQFSCQEAFEKINNLSFLTLEFQNVHLEDLSPVAGFNKLYLIGCYNGCNARAIQTIPAIESLRSISFSGANLKEVPDLSHLPNLERLELYDNPIKNVSKPNLLERLTHLSLAKTEIENLSFLQDLPNLKSLDIAQNQNKTLPSLPEHNGLQKLFVDSMELENLDFLKKTPNIEYLSVTQNKLTSLAGLSIASKLADLNAHGNSISIISENSLPTTIRSLRLSWNKIKGFNFIANLPNLRVLALAKTGIDSWEFILPLMGRLAVLDVSGNPIGNPNIVGDQQQYWHNLYDLYLNDTNITSLGFLKNIDLPILRDVGFPNIQNKNEQNCPTIGMPEVVVNFCKKQPPRGTETLHFFEF